MAAPCFRRAAVVLLALCFTSHLQAADQPHPAQRRPVPTPAQPNAAPTPAATPNNGRDSILKAYQLTRTANSEAACNQVIELCKTGLRQGLDKKMTIYARRLSAWGYNRRGEARADAGNSEPAFEDFESAVALDDRNWRAVHNRGVSQAMLGKTDAAINDFTRTIELNPNFANAWFNRGEMRYENRDFAGAVRDYTEALRQNPRDAAALNSRGHAYYRLKRNADALADYNQAIAIDPASAAAFVNRGDLLADQGKFGEAAKDFQAAIKANPSLGRAYQSAAWLMSTCPEDKFRNAELALETAQKAIELDGEEDYRYLETLAAAQANLGEFKAAIATQQRAVAIAPAAVAQVYKGRIEKYQAGEAHREPVVNFAAGSAPRGRR